MQHKFYCDISCCVEWTSLVFFDAACYPDVNFRSSNEVRDDYSSCYATSLNVSTFDLKYYANIFYQRNSANMKTCVIISFIIFTSL